ncbi:phosphate/phosphite/phosphonate ABC transporter substrate-binding protein [Roseibium sp.]|uniref:phosphate/phosphite/phosphonate ABC transporter substrate-binding protein n=1 Tax=Roseibium sp. TaxID=1936156 RepID=UPI003B523D64
MTVAEFRPVRLPMYDWPEVADETRVLEAALTDEICHALAIAPSTLQPWEPDIDLYDLWKDPGLLLAQTCGYPFTHDLKGKVSLIGAPEHEAVGCSGPAYCSQIIVAASSPFRTLADLKGSRAAFNGPDSQSGMNALRHALALLANGRPFFKSVAESGGHLASMAAVAEGRADVAAIDAVCWALAGREKPQLVSGLRALTQTAQAPGLPYITSVQFSPVERQKIAEAISSVFAKAETAKSRERLCIRGFSKLVPEDYTVILEMETQAAAAGYPVLA